MTASPETLAAFEAWKLAEVAAFLASPCDDEVMDRLVDIAGGAFDALQLTPTTNADDMLLKLFPLLLRDMEPTKRDAPLRPGASRSYNYPDEFYDTLIANLNASSPIIRSALAITEGARL